MNQWEKRRMKQSWWGKITQQSKLQITTANRENNEKTAANCPENLFHLTNHCRLASSWLGMSEPVAGQNVFLLEDAICFSSVHHPIGGDAPHSTSRWSQTCRRIESWRRAALCFKIKGNISTSWKHRSNGIESDVKYRYRIIIETL